MYTEAPWHACLTYLNLDAIFSFHSAFWCCGCAVHPGSQIRDCCTLGKSDSGRSGSGLDDLRSSSQRTSVVVDLSPSGI